MAFLFRAAAFCAAAALCLHWCTGKPIRAGETTPSSVPVYTADDVSALRGWLLGDAKTSFPLGWGYDDCDADGQLTAADLTLMKRALLPSPAADAATLRFYDGDTLVYAAPLRTSQLALPGLPSAVRHADASFSHYSTAPDDSGERYDPGDVFYPVSGANTLYLIWEDAPTGAGVLTEQQRIVQVYEKTPERSSTYPTQGGTYAEYRGKAYWIQAYVREIAEADTEKYQVAAPGNYTALFVYDFTTGDILASSFGIPFGHANDLEFNAETGEIILCSAAVTGEAVTVVSLDLQSYRQFTPAGTEGLRVVGCAYNDADGCYYLTVMPENSNYLRDSTEILRFDADWQPAGSVAAPFASPENHYGFQGADIADGRYYLVDFLKDNWQGAEKCSFKYARVSIYDCSTMQYLGSVPVPVTDEIEDVAVCGDKVYLIGQIFKDQATKLISARLYDLQFDLPEIP